MQQYAVDSWAKIEDSRLNWAKQHPVSKETIRAGTYQDLIDAFEAGDEHNAGGRIVLPPQFTALHVFTTSNCIIASSLFAIMVNLITS